MISQRYQGGRIKKLLVILPISWGGVVHSTIAFINDLAKILHNVEIYVLKPKDSYTYLFIKRNNLRVFEVFKAYKFERDKPYYILYLSNIVKFIYNVVMMRIWLKNIHADLIYLPAPYPQFLFLPQKRNIVLTVHAVFSVSLKTLISNIGILNTLLYYLTELTIKRLSPSIVIVHTLSDLKLFKSKFHYLRVKIFKASLPMILEPEKDYCLSENQYKKNLVLLYFGYIVRGKGIDILLKAYGKIERMLGCERVPFLILVGQGNPDIINKQLKNIKCKDKVIVFNTFIPEKFIPKIFNLADVVILPYTFHKGYSGVLKLAFNFCKAIIASTAGDLPELLGFGKYGVLFPTGDVDALARILYMITQDRQIIKALKNRLDNMLKSMRSNSFDYIDIFRKVIQGM